MDKNTIVQAIMSLIIMGLGGALAWLFNSISELQHESDIKSIKIEYLQQSSDKVWQYVDEDLRRNTDEKDKEIQELKTELNYYRYDKR